MRTISTFNAYHLGDNLVHLHFLRKLAQAYPQHRFVHGAPDEHLGQLYSLWQDLPNLTVKSIAEVGQGAINAWRGAGGHWYSHPQRQDCVAYHLEWFQHLAKVMGLESPLHYGRDLLFDYPELRNALAPLAGHAWDFLLINSAPQSGQWQGYSGQAFTDLALRLRYLGKKVISTRPTGVPSVPSTSDVQGDITHIGHVAQISRCIIGCVTGPMWPCLNIWNADTVALRVHLLDQERVDHLPEHTAHCNSLSLVPEILKDRGLL